MGKQSIYRCHDHGGIGFASDCGLCRTGAPPSPQPPADEALKLLREARDDLFRLGQDSATAYEHGAWSDADKEAKALHDRIDRYLAGRG